MPMDTSDSDGTTGRWSQSVGGERLRTDGNPGSLADEWRVDTPVAAPVRYRYVAEFEPGTEFQVTVVEMDGSDVISLSLSYVTDHEESHRHDYRINDYDHLETALEDVDALIDVLTDRLREATIDAGAPDPEAVGQLVTQFGRERSDSWRSRVRGWLQSLPGGGES